MTHWVTRGKQVVRVPARRKGAVQILEISTRVRRLEKRRATFSISRGKIFCDLQKKLSGKKASLGMTYEAQTEANDKVWDLNQKMEKAWRRWRFWTRDSKRSEGTLAMLSRSLTRIFEEMQDAMGKAKEVLIFVENCFAGSSRQTYGLPHVVQGS